MKSPHRTHRDGRYFEIRCAALEVRVKKLEAALDDLYGLVRKQGMDDGFRDRIESLLPTVGKRGTA